MTIASGALRAARAVGTPTITAPSSVGAATAVASAKLNSRAWHTSAATGAADARPRKPSAFSPEIVDQDALARTVQRCADNDILLPTFEQLAHPELIPEKIKKALKTTGMHELSPLNLFRLTWKNEPDPKEEGKGGLYGGVNYIELPSEITGVKAKICLLVGTHFPTAAHKVGATYGPLASRLVTGQFDVARHKALWPSTGNYCRGGAYNSHLLGVPCIAVLPEGMSKERFDWLNKVGAEIHATPGSESNVKEVFDKTHELHKANPNEVVVLNQFAEFTNPLFHYYCTGRAMSEAFEGMAASNPDLRLAGTCFTQGSAGTLAAGDFVKDYYPGSKLAAAEALQCPTLSQNGYGAHRIEGIGDKMVPWIHNVRNMDMVVDVDDEACMRIARLFNEDAGRAYLKQTRGVSTEVLDQLPLMGVSAIANMLTAVKMAKYYEMKETDVIFSVATDSMGMYMSRLKELEAESGPYDSVHRAEADYERFLGGASAREHVYELSHYDRKRMHNLKYFTWVEQQGKTVEELDAQWHDADEYWHSKWRMAEDIDAGIRRFNDLTGLAAKFADEASANDSPHAAAAAVSQ